VAQAESDGYVAVWASRLAEDEEMAARMRRADEEYRALRAAEGEGDDPCLGVGIAGQADPCATKCLHAHVSAYLAGIDDPLGRELIALWGADCHDDRCASIVTGETEGDARG
jgi:hypothetical protein